MSGDILKKKILEIWQEYVKDAKRLGHTIKRKWRYFKENLQDAVYDAVMRIRNTNNKKKYVLIASFLIVLNVLIINLLISYSFYNNEAAIPIVHSKVGDMYTANYDYVLQVFLENTNPNSNDKKYFLANNIPSGGGYRYSGYKCVKGSTLNYDEENKNTSIDLLQKESCSIYFDLESSLDVKVNIMLEEGINSETYVLGKNIPVYGYRYNNFSCENGSELTYNSETHAVNVLTDGKESCNIYFKKEQADVVIDLFIENGFGTGDYIVRETIPQNGTYNLNATKSYCENNLKERLDGVLSYSDGYIETLSESVAYCTVYLDKNE